MAVLFFYPIWILLYQNEKVNGGMFGQLVLGLTSLVILPFFFKFTQRWVGNRRIEIRPKDNVFVFIESSSKENKKIPFEEIKGFTIEHHKYPAMTVQRKNYSLILETNSAKDLHMCTSDSHKNIEAIYELLSRNLPRFFRSK